MNYSVEQFINIVHPQSFMRHDSISILLTLLIITAAAGCLGEDDSDGGIVGDWYHAESLELVFNSDGSSVGEPDDNHPYTGNWSINDNGTLNLHWDNDPAVTVWFVVDGDWLFINTEEEPGNCGVFSRVSIDGSVWSSTVDALTLPSICE